MESNVSRGRRGEGVAAAWLRNRGWTILDRNWRDGPRELDLVARRCGVVAFVEVKTRTSDAWGLGLAAIGPRKRREIERASRRWIHERAAEVGGSVRQFRFDAFSVHFRPGRSPECQHVPAAWMVGE